MLQAWWLEQTLTNLLIVLALISSVILFFPVIDLTVKTQLENNGMGKWNFYLLKGQHLRNEITI